MIVCPQKNSVNGTTLLRSARTEKAAHTRAPRGTATPIAAMTAPRTAAPKPTRSSTKVSGGSAATATLAKKNDPPHRIESETRRAHSVAFIGRESIADVLHPSRPDGHCKNSMRRATRFP